MRNHVNVTLRSTAAGSLRYTDKDVICMTHGTKGSRRNNSPFYTPIHPACLRCSSFK